MVSEELVKHVVSLLLDVDEAQLTIELPLREIPGWDSVNALRVLVYLEQEAGSKLDYERFMAAEKLGELWTPSLEMAHVPLSGVRAEGMAS